MVEGTESKSEKEGKGNLDNQPGYQLGIKWVKTFGWMRWNVGRTLVIK
jgi:hypothetical protein